MPRASQARARSVTGSARSVTNMRMPRCTRLLHVGGHGRLGLLEVVDGLLLEPVLQRLVALLVLLGGLAQVLALGLGLLDLRKELLLQLDGGLRPRRQREREAERGHPDRVAHGGHLARLLSRSASRGASTPRQQGSSRFEPAVLSLEEDEGRATPELGVLDGADVDHVVSPLVRLDDATLDEIG